MRARNTLELPFHLIGRYMVLGPKQVFFYLIQWIVRFSGNNEQQELLVLSTGCFIERLTFASRTERTFAGYVSCDVTNPHAFKSSSWHGCLHFSELFQDLTMLFFLAFSWIILGFNGVNFCSARRAHVPSRCLNPGGLVPPHWILSIRQFDL